VFVDKFCGNTDTRLADQHIAAGTCRERTKSFSDPLCQSSPPQKAVGNIRSNLYASLHQFPYRKPQTEKTVDPDHCSSSIGASSGHTCGNGNKFLQLHRNSLLDMEFIH